MLSLYHQLRSVVFGGEEQHDSSKNPPIQGPTAAVTRKREERFFNGVVSSMNQSSGMIDHLVFFELGAVMGGLTPEVGSAVHVSAEREHSQAGWRAIRVEVTSAKWQPDTESRTRVLIGYISKTSPTKCIVDCSTEEVAFSPQEVSTTSYRPHVNDWVQLTILHQDGQTLVNDVQPLREKTLTASVSSVSQGFGTIGDDIYFVFSACVRGYRPRVGEEVRVVCVEYQHPRSNWRATHVEPVSSQPPRQTRPVSSLLSSLLTPQPLTSTPSLLEDKGGITITDNGDFGKVGLGEKRSIVMTISNHSGRGQELLTCRPLVRDPQLQFSLPPREERRENASRGRVVGVAGGKGDSGEGGGVEGCPESVCDGESSESESSDGAAGYYIPDGGKLEVTLKLEARELGQLSVLLLFNFGGTRIARCVRASVTDLRIDSLSPVAPYTGRGSRRDHHAHYQTKLSACKIPGERPLRPHPLRLPHRLKPYPIPDALRACLDEGGDVEDIRPEMEEPLCMENYSARFSTLLFLEELKREEDIRQFDMFSVSLRRCGPFLSLGVPGLAEGRPSLLVGDKVILCPPGGDECSHHWEGFIHEVRGGDVLLRFSEEFHEHFRNDDYDIMFTFTRTPLRRMHHAVENAPAIGPKVLFPGQPSATPPLLKLGNRPFFNTALNPRQRVAVARILAGQCHPAPYILFGPPGTGKTVTLVEAILQVHSLSTGSRILACAPSNSAADLLAERLHLSGLVNPGVMVRLNAVQRFQPPPPSVQPYSMDTDSLVVASRCRIIISTCVTAGILHSLGLGVGHFSHVFVDEAGQATEPECLIPVALLAGTLGQTTLVGDPQQLGPVLSSLLSDTLGLGLSLLERLMDRPAYQRNQRKFSDHGNYDPLMVTKLVDNYRSHESLLQLYSDIFYHGELQPMADPALTHCLCRWELLPKRGFPLVFHGTQGEDMREGSSPSWFNPVEAVQVIKYVQALMDNSTFAPKISDIGIITPYRKQVEKIRLLLQRVGVEGVKVGSVEEFQGQERRAIIISTVRSSQDLLGFDHHHHLGFLSNPKRFNVAISRAQALLIVIGNPHLLTQDPHWCQLVQYAMENGTYTGCPLPPHSPVDSSRSLPPDSPVDSSCSLPPGPVESSPPDCPVESSSSLPPDSPVDSSCSLPPGPVESSPPDCPVESSSSLPPDSPVDSSCSLPPGPVESSPPDSPVESSSSLPPDCPVENSSSLPPDSPVDTL